MSNNISIRLEKRRMETIVQLNDDSCAEIEAISKKLKRNVSDDKQEKEVSEEIIKITENISDELDSLGVLLFDDKAVRKLMRKHFGESYCDELEKKTNLTTNKNMSDPCRELIKLLSNSPPSTAVFRRILRKSTLGDEEFDPVIHSDLNFVEVTSLHFLNLITSPRNPIQHVALERTAATITTVQILNCLFLSNNDIIDLIWFEKKIKLIKDAKWDAVAFRLKDKRFTSMLIEFSGGFNFNTTSKKEHDDEGKLVKAIKDILTYTDAVRNQEYPIPQYYVRFFGREICFESICLSENEKLLKRHYFSITCPSTCVELIELVAMFPQLLEWKQTIVNYTKEIISSFFSIVFFYFRLIKCIDMTL